MSVSIDDLKPKNFVIKIKGVELNCKPLRLTHALTLSNLGSIFDGKTKSTKEEIAQAQKDLDLTIGELIPQLDGVELDMQTTMEVITQLLATISPSDNKELTERGVKMDTDPKVQKIG